ncbi:hypothetical protein PC9H_010089 [Pleurotus ostreatus]|uniref:Yeast cell wall synthesis Kre9/Knh1-like N-terminal domain-containing protein n=1 Tax=Pleurotus ostreatus TaxID=5322 RepID=A0A8H6ZN47_PLEOS|nr:uncharacterized protein PC9H_010089 [Pleurotus ostreatus]KAF7424778.1 hypothetical protein PC9H_010089 [Pleurotus ostreatus]KAJ8692216.1 hypothetical protein PTI98_009550 [Pleurotus ostreatus]
MFSQLIVALALSSFSLAYNITSPGDSHNWTERGPQPATWERASTDPETVTVVLTNKNSSVMAENQVIATSLDGKTGKAELNPPKGKWPAGEGFILNFCQKGHTTDAILAQSKEFSIIGVGSEGVDSLPSTLPQTQNLDTPPQVAKSNGAMAAFEATKDGLMGLLGFLALMAV